MQKMFIAVCGVVAFGLTFTLAFAMNHIAIERGQAHFNNKDFAGGTKPCSTCHAQGKGLEGAGAKTEFMGGSQDTLEGAINLCIVNANKGQAIQVDSEEMQDIASYIKSLGK